MRFRRVLRESRAVRLSPEMQRVVLEQRLGFVATVTAEGRPNLSPKGTTTLWDEEHLMFADLASPGTIENLATNPHRRDKRRRPDPAQGLPLQGNSRRLYECPNVRSRVGDPAGSWVNGHPRSGAFDRGDRRASAAPVVSPAYDDGTSEETIVQRWRQHYERLHHPQPG